MDNLVNEPELAVNAVEDFDAIKFLEQEQPKRNKYLGKFLSVNDLLFLQQVNAQWTQEIPKDLQPSFYMTGSYENDIQIQNELFRILEVPVIK